MERKRPYWQVAVSLMFSILATAAFIILGVKAIGFLMPFVVGWIISAIATPLVNWLEKRLKIVKKLGTAMIVIMVIGLIVLVGYFAVSRIAAEVTDLIQNFPDIYAQLEEGMREIGNTLSGAFSRLPRGVQNGWTTIVENLDTYMGNLVSKISEPTVTAAGNFAKRLPSYLISFIVAILAAYFFTIQREEVIAWFQANVPVAETELHYNNPYELLIAVILSAQCTDKRVNMITPPLYKDFPTPEALAASTPEVIFEYIRSVSYPNNKAKHLVGMAKMLVNDFNSKVPDNMDDLIKLPGVGRKTANVIQSVVFNKAAMAVDTHVFRVSHRIGLVPDSCTTPFSVEKELVKNIPEKLIPIAHHWLILHGRYVCQARTPKCDTCGLQMMCKYFCNTYKVTKEAPKAKNK